METASRSSSDKEKNSSRSALSSAKRASEVRGLEADGLDAPVCGVWRLTVSTGFRYAFALTGGVADTVTESMEETDASKVALSSDRASFFDTAAMLSPRFSSSSRAFSCPCAAALRNQSSAARSSLATDITPRLYWLPACPCSAALRNQFSAARSSLATPSPLTYIMPRLSWASTCPCSAALRNQSSACCRSLDTPRLSRKARPSSYCAWASPAWACCTSGTI